MTDRVTALRDAFKLVKETLRDNYTFVDSGYGLGSADLWVIVDGVEIYINMRPSNREMAKEER